MSGASPAPWESGDAPAIEGSSRDVISSFQRWQPPLTVRALTRCGPAHISAGRAPALRVSYPSAIRRPSPDIAAVAILPWGLLFGVRVMPYPTASDMRTVSRSQPRSGLSTGRQAPDVRLVAPLSGPFTAGCGRCEGGDGASSDRPGLRTHAALTRPFRVITPASLYLLAP